MTAHGIRGIALMGLAIVTAACGEWPGYRRNMYRTGNQTVALTSCHAKTQNQDGIRRNQNGKSNTEHELAQNLARHDIPHRGSRLALGQRHDT